IYPAPASSTTPTTVYKYTWDELGRLATAKRIDSGTVRANESFLYDANGQRVIVRDQQTSKSTINVFSSLLIKQATYTATANAYDTTGTDANGFGKEHAYLGGGTAHVFSDPANTLPSLCPTSGSGACGTLHMFLSVPDRLGSTSFVLDSATGEVVERTTHQAYGALDADFRPARWHSYREDWKFGGQADNAEVGLVYFNARYYA